MSHRIMFNGCEYGGVAAKDRSDNCNEQHITQLEYDLLSESEKKNGTVYFISNDSAGIDIADTTSTQDTATELHPLVCTRCGAQLTVFNGEATCSHCETHFSSRYKMEEV